MKIFKKEFNLEEINDVKIMEVIRVDDYGYKLRNQYERITTYTRISESYFHEQIIEIHENKTKKSERDVSSQDIEKIISETGSKIDQSYRGRGEGKSFYRSGAAE